jgi:hypothetical protein
VDSAGSPLLNVDVLAAQFPHASLAWISTLSSTIGALKVTWLAGKHETAYNAAFSVGLGARVG